MRRLLTLVALFCACTQPCRLVDDVNVIDVDCADEASFTGEIHLESRATFISFLRDDCLLNATASAAGALADPIDFSQDAVFVAVGNARDGERCLAARKLGACEVCENGLKVSFDDDDNPGELACDRARWTVAFTLPRDELRTALIAGQAIE